MSLEPADITRIYRRMAAGLLVFFQRRVHDPEVATDLLADTFALAIERAHLFEGRDDRALSGWVWRIAQGVLREHERRELTVAHVGQCHIVCQVEAPPRREATRRAWAFVCSHISLSGSVISPLTHPHREVSAR